MPRFFWKTRDWALHDCCENKKETVVESVDNQRSLVWASSRLSMGLFAVIVWIVSARYLMRRGANFESVPVEQDDKFGKKGARQVAPTRHGGGRVLVWLVSLM